ncbi:RHS repeat-associated core domain-containing protein [Montanilutibacter psychrotolerans]|uniref:RHS repeat-associated core domain-containing protein n=1 Tax=Montanilutibacter psychrotolerans TaxID=1327343 RepID=UPI001CC1F516|nr:RHS repeat-associated core domain-containing protein [Lysobacter psychrotolerans]
MIQNFDYGPDGSRIRQWGTDGELMYFGTVERQYAPTMQDKTYVGSSVVVTQAGSTRRVDYLLTDRLGSVDALADSSGAMLETRGFDAFGKPRSGTWADATKLASTGNSRHGFTGHEHLNSLSLIHMNGRVYDYNLGRFTGVDPVIQFPLNSQSLNPYSYILNNPLSGTDPTGYQSRGSICDVGNTENANDCIEYESGNSRSGRAAKKSSGGNGATGSGSRREQAAPAGQKGSALFASGVEALRNTLFPTAVELAERGEQGTTVSNSIGALKEFANLEMTALTPQAFRLLGGPTPRFSIANDELGGAASMEATIAFVGVVGGGEGAMAGRAGTASAIGMRGGGAGRDGAIDLVRALDQVIRQKAGFGDGQAVILDENLAARGMAEALRSQGFNLRSVQEIFGRGNVLDPRILELARRIDARVLTRDVGRQLDGGFHERAIIVDYRVRSPEQVGRVLREGAK